MLTLLSLFPLSTPRWFEVLQFFQQHHIKPQFCLVAKAQLFSYFYLYILLISPIFLYNNRIYPCQGHPCGHARTGSMMMAELEVDHTNLPRVQEGEQTPSRWTRPAFVQDHDRRVRRSVEFQEERFAVRVICSSADMGLMSGEKRKYSRLLVKDALSENIPVSFFLFWGTDDIIFLIYCVCNGFLRCQFVFLVEGLALSVLTWSRRGRCVWKQRHGGQVWVGQIRGGMWSLLKR